MLSVLHDPSESACTPNLAAPVRDRHLAKTAGIKRSGFNSSLPRNCIHMPFGDRLPLLSDRVFLMLPAWKRRIANHGCLVAAEKALLQVRYQQATVDRNVLADGPFPSTGDFLVSAVAMVWWGKICGGHYHRDKDRL